MAETLSPRRHRRWWIIPLVLVLVLLSGLILSEVCFLQPGIEQWSWKLATRGFDGENVAATGEDNIVLVGSHVLQFNGLFWRRAILPSLIARLRLGKTPVCYVCEVDEEKMPTMRWSICPQPFTAVEAYDSQHIYVSGRVGILHFNGLWWSPMPIAKDIDPHPYSIWAQNSDSVYALDKVLGLLHWNGHEWNDIDLGDGFQPILVGGTQDTVVVSGQNQALMVRDDRGWQHVDIQPLVTNLTPNEYSEPGFSLRPRRVFGLEDGRIVVAIDDLFYFGPKLLIDTRALLMFEDGVWSSQVFPCETEVLDVCTTDDGYLRILGEYGYRYRQVPGELDEPPQWTALDEYPLERIWGFTELQSSDSLTVYGGLWRIPESCSRDCWPKLELPCRVESYELTW